jgi:hypothetical protein
MAKVGATDPALLKERRVYATVVQGGRIEVGQSIRVDPPEETLAADVAAR